MRATQSVIVLSTSVSPKWEYIKPLREFVEVFAETTFGKKVSGSASVVVNELLENAIKYGDAGGNVGVDLRHETSQHMLELRIGNSARPARITILEREVARITQDGPKEAFSRAVGRLTRMPEGMSMLGLARVASNADLSVEVDGARVVCVARIGHGRGAARVARVPA